MPSVTVVVPYPFPSSLYESQHHVILWLALVTLSFALHCTSVTIDEIYRLSNIERLHIIVKPLDQRLVTTVSIS